MSTHTAGAVTQGTPVLPDQLFAGPDEEPDRWQLHGTGMTGGEGTTWEAHYLGRLTAPLPRAVKMLHRPPGAAGDWPAGSDLRRWDDQLAVLRHLDPKRVVRLFSVTTGPPPHPRGQYAATRAGEQPVVYLEMEWLDGPTLDALVRGRPATPGTLPDRLRFVEQAAEAVADLHSRTRTGGNPALHRDLKPGNCIVDTKRGLVLIDVSTLRLSDDGADPLGRHTPGYTAPEVMAEPIRAREARSDVYSLGALAVFCLTGEDPPLPSVRATGRLARQVRAAARAAGVRNATAFAGHLTAAVAAHPERRPVDVQRWARILTTLGGPVETRPRRHHRSAARRILRPAGAAGMTAAALVLAAGAFGLTRIHGAPTSQTTGGETGLVRPSATATSTAAAPSGAPQPRPTSQLASSTPTPTPTRRPSTAPTGSAGPGAPRPPTRPPAPVRAAGAIAAPAGGASVPQCAYFSGTATLPTGDTLILAMQNISNGQADQYVEFVFGWQTPAPRWTWRGAQFFGTGDESVGQRYRVRLMAVALAEARRLDNSPALAATGTTLDSVELRRVAGPGPDGCVGS